MFVERAVHKLLDLSCSNCTTKFLFLALKLVLKKMFQTEFGLETQTKRNRTVICLVLHADYGFDFICVTIIEPRLFKTKNWNEASFFGFLKKFSNFYWKK